MSAYAETYLAGAMKNLAEAFDYAVNACKIPADDFGKGFLVSGLATAWESGSPKLLAGLSGTELAAECLARIGLARKWPSARVDPLSRTPEYWTGWVLAYYQWKTARPFAEIFSALPPGDILRLYHPLHEANEDRFCDRAEAILKRIFPETHLRQRRTNRGLSQAELASQSGVNIRNIQQYEQRVKDVNHAAANTLLALARVLGCRIEDLLEP